jgi:hypothetical protein
MVPTKATELAEHLIQEPDNNEIALVLADLLSEQESLQGNLIQIKAEMESIENRGSNAQTHMQLRQAYRHVEDAVKALFTIQFGGMVQPTINHRGWLHYLTVDGHRITDYLSYEALDAIRIQFPLLRGLLVENVGGRNCPVSFPDLVEQIGHAYTTISMLSLENVPLHQTNLESLMNTTVMQLISLELTNNRLDPEILACLLSGKLCAQLIEFNLDNPVGDDGVCQVVEAAETWEKLTCLEFCGCDVGPVGIDALGQSHQLRSLKSASVINDRFDDEMMQILTNAKILKQWEALYLSHNQISDKGARMLAEYKMFPQLKWLDLSDNHLSAQGCDVLRNSSGFHKDCKFELWQYEP